MYSCNLYFCIFCNFVFSSLFLFSFCNLNFLTHGIDTDSWYWQGLMVWTWTHGIDEELWYRYDLMVWKTPMVLTKTHGIVSVLLNYTHTRGPSDARIQDSCYQFQIKRQMLNSFVGIIKKI